MPAFPQYKFTLVFILILLLPGIAMRVNGQDDSARSLSEFDKIPDTVPVPQFDEPADADTYQDSAISPASIYFLEKELQENGGGPDSLQVRMLPDSLVAKMKSDPDFWYVDYVFSKEKKKQQQRTFSQSAPFQTILWLVIIGGFAAFVVIYLANSNVGLFRKGHKLIQENEDGDVETSNIFGINYQKEIDRAIAASNYRFAVRLMFLRLLKTMSDKNVIEYKHDRTNFDYLTQLHSTRYYHDFFRLTRNYEYSWYGQFPIEPEKFNIIKNEFDNFDRNLSNR